MPRYIYAEYDDESEFSSSPSSSSSFSSGGDSAAGLWADHPANCMCVQCSTLRASAERAKRIDARVQMLSGHRNGCPCESCEYDRRSIRYRESRSAAGVVEFTPKPPAPPSGRRIRTRMTRGDT